MRSITNAAHHRQDGYRSVVKLVSSSPSLSITEANIVQGGFVYDSRVVEGSAFQVGTAIADEIHVTLDNSTGVYNRSYLGVEFTVSISCKNISTGTQDSWYQLGLFTVTEVDESDSATTTMTLQDRMVKLDQVIPAFTAATLYSNLSSFCTTLGITLVTTNTNPLQKWTVVSTTNENSITYRDFVRGCALLLGRNARFTNDGKLEFTQNIASTAVATLGPADRFASRMGELQHLGGVEVYDGEGVLLFSRNTHNNDTYRTVIDPSSSVIFEILGGIEAVVTGFQACVSSGSSYYPHSFSINMDYYPCEITAMNWWEIQTWDKVNYTKSGTNYPIIITSVASNLNGHTSMTSTAEEDDRYVPTMTDEIRSTTQDLRTVSTNAQSTATTAYQNALKAMPKYATNSQSGSTVAKTVSVDNFELVTGAKVTVRFTNANTAASPTLNVSSTGAKTILTSDGTAITSANADTASWPANSLVTFTYDGTNWRIEDAALLTRIDHIFAEDIVGDNGWINLKGGEFVFTDSDTGDSIAFNDGALSMTGTVNATGGTISGDMTVTGTLEGATIEGSEMSIRATGDITNTNLTYDDRVATTTAGVLGDDPITYKSISLEATSADKTTQAINNNTSITLDPYLGRISIIGEDKISFSLREPGQSYYQEKMALSKTQSNAIELSVNGNLSAKPKSISRSLISVTGVSVGSLQVYSTAGLAMVTLELTLTGALSDWTTIASGLPDAAFDWYDTASSWGTSFTRNMRVHVDTYGYLEIRYGAATSYRISFSYPTA